MGKREGKENKSSICEDTSFSENTFDEYKSFEYFDSLINKLPKN